MRLLLILLVTLLAESLAQEDENSDDVFEFNPRAFAFNAQQPHIQVPSAQSRDQSAQFPLQNPHLPARRPASHDQDTVEAKEGDGEEVFDENEEDPFTLPSPTKSFIDTRAQPVETSTEDAEERRTLKQKEASRESRHPETAEMADDEGEEEHGHQNEHMPASEHEQNSNQDGDSPFDESSLAGIFDETAAANAGAPHFPRIVLPANSLPSAHASIPVYLTTTRSFTYTFPPTTTTTTTMPPEPEPQTEEEQQQQEMPHEEVQQEQQEEHSEPMTTTTTQMIPPQQVTMGQEHIQEPRQEVQVPVNPVPAETGKVDLAVEAQNETMINEVQSEQKGDGQVQGKMEQEQSNMNTEEVTGNDAEEATPTPAHRHMLSSTELTLTLVNMEYDDKLDFTDSGEFKRLSRQATNQLTRLLKDILKEKFLGVDVNSFEKVQQGVKILAKIDTTQPIEDNQHLATMMEMAIEENENKLGLLEADPRSVRIAGVASHSTMQATNAENKSSSSFIAILIAVCVTIILFAALIVIYVVNRRNNGSLKLPRMETLRAPACAPVSLMSYDNGAGSYRTVEKSIHIKDTP